MASVVIVPTHSRPEMLHLCLERLSKAHKAGATDIWVVLDRHIGDDPQHAHEAGSIAEQFGAAFMVREAHSYPGNSYNVLTAHKQAYSGGYDWIYLVEDDVLVALDFFQWHRATHERYHPFVSVGARNTRSEQLVTKDDYASLGVCFHRSALQHVIEHAKPEYVADLRGYCQRTFGDLCANEDCEQDGLILRVMKSINGTAVFPETPVCEHVGWYGYHRPGQRPTGTLGQRINQVRERLHAAV